MPLKYQNLLQVILEQTSYCSEFEKSKSMILVTLSKQVKSQQKQIAALEEKLLSIQNSETSSRVPETDTFELGA